MLKIELGSKSSIRTVGELEPKLAGTAGLSLALSHDHECIETEGPGQER